MQVLNQPGALPQADFNLPLPRGATMSKTDSSKQLQMPDLVLSGLSLPFLNMDPNSTAESI